MHGDMSQAARERTLARFAAGKVSTLVATDVAARGLDLPDITHVINFDPPEDEKAYVHRSAAPAAQAGPGRASRLCFPTSRATSASLPLASAAAKSSSAMDSVRRAKLVYSGRRRRNSRW